MTTALNWKTKGRYHTIDGKALFTIDTGPNDKNNTPLTLLHGYPTSSYDFWRVLPDLQKERRVIVHDHLGFGYSDKPDDYSYSLIEQADMALKLWKSLGVTEMSLLAHDYGTSVATEIIARRNLGHEPIKIKQLILCNGSIHVELANLRIIQHLLKNRVLGKYVARLSQEWIFIRNMKRLWYDRKKVDTDELKEMWYLLNYNDGKKNFHKVSQYIHERYLYWHRWIGNLQKLNIPVYILWGKEDPVAVKTIAKALHQEIKDAKLIWLSKTGHYPMLENPEGWTTAVLNILND